MPTAGVRRVLDRAVDHAVTVRPVYLAGYWVGTVAASVALFVFGRRHRGE